MMKPVNAKMWRECGEQNCLNIDPVCQLFKIVCILCTKGVLGKLFCICCIVISRLKRYG